MTTTLSTVGPEKQLSVLRAVGELVDNYVWPHRAHINAEL